MYMARNTDGTVMATAIPKDSGELIALRLYAVEPSSFRVNRMLDEVDFSVGEANDLIKAIEAAIGGFSG